MLGSTAAGAAAGTSVMPGWGTAVGAGLGLASSFLTGGSSEPTGVNYNMHRELNQRRRFHEQQIEQIPQAIKAKVEGLKASGLHPLAALGMSFPTTSGPSGSGPSIPGQNRLGSAVSEGINTALSLKQAELGLQEQELRNDYLQEQIKASKIARLSQAANAVNDQQKFKIEESPFTVSGKEINTIAPPPEVTNDSTVLNIFGKKVPIKAGQTTAQGAEDTVGGAIAELQGIWLAMEGAFAPDKTYHAKRYFLGSKYNPAKLRDVRRRIGKRAQRRRSHFKRNLPNL